MFAVKGSIWIESNKGAFIGMGRIILLEKIKEHGSITVAAKSMKMSYRQAWELVDSMNKLSKYPLVIKSSGGTGGGGTKVTKEGEKIIDLFTDLNKRFHKFNEEESKKLKL
ncbi:MAG: LysR family transcriptional regulator [Bacteroidetes bacterium]|nr:LysR family transcriptional regulator [Bacteroidota bacterium]